MNHKYGDIFLYENITKEVGNAFVNEISKRQSSNVIKLRINSGGGSVFQGYTMMNSIYESKAKIHAYIDGIVASMSTGVALACDKVFMADNALFMIHNPSLSSEGSYGKNELLSKAKELEKIEETLTNIYVAKTGLDREVIISMMNKETWLTASEALELGFIDEITNKVLRKKGETRAEITMMDENDLHTLYIKPIDMNKEEILAKHGLSAKASNDDLLKKLDEIQNKLDNNSQEEVFNKISNCVLNGSISAKQQTTFEALVEDGKGSQVVEILNEFKEPVNLGEKIKEAKRKKFTNGAKEFNEATATLEDYRKHAPEKLKNNPALFEKLFEKEYGEK